MFWLWLLELFVYVIVPVLEAPLGRQLKRALYKKNPSFMTDEHKVHVALTGCHGGQLIHSSVIWH
jgi:hypothetical protein